MTLHDLRSVGLDINTIGRLKKSGLLLEPIKGEYTTPHAELIRKITNLSLIPGMTLPLEWLILGPIESPLPNFSYCKVDDLRASIFSFLQRRKVKSEDAEWIAASLVEGLKSSGVTGLSKYQCQMIKKILDEEKWPLIAVLSAPTGSGKTLIFTIIAIVHALSEKVTGSPRPSVMMIYPRKALARNQLQRLAAIVFYVNSYLESLSKNRSGKALQLTLGILDGDSPRGNLKSELKELKGKPVRGLLLKAGLPVECKYEYNKYNSNLRTKCYNREGKELPYILASDLRIELIEEPPDILITNRYMLEYHINPLLKNKKYIKLFNNSTLLILDEAHVYSGPESVLIASLIHRLYLYKYNKNNKKEFVSNYAAKHALILSSATITTAHINRKYSNEREVYDIFQKDIKKFTESLIPAKLLSYFKSERQRNPIISEPYEIIENKNNKKRLSLILLLMPRPTIAASTLMQETILATLVWSLALKHNEAGRQWKFIAFFDNKDDLERINEWIKEVIIKNRCEHCDRLGIPEGNIETNQCLVHSSYSTYYKEQWKNYILEILGERSGKLDPNFYAEKLNRFKKLVRDHRLWVSLATAVRGSNPKVKIEILAKEVCKYSNYVGVHHADLKRAIREQVEDKLKRGELLGLLSTQTLELGIDIGDVSIILQYKPPRSAENFIQRIGRAGRSPESLYTSLGILVLSHIDVPYLNKQFAIKHLLEVRPSMPPYKNLNLLIILLLKYAIFQAFLDNDNEFLEIFNNLLNLLENNIINNIKKYKINSKIVKVLYKKLSNYEDKVIARLKELVGNHLDEETIRHAYSLILKEIEEIHSMLRPALTSEEARDLRIQINRLKSLINNIFKECNNILYHTKYNINKPIKLILDNIINLFDNLENDADLCSRRTQYYISTRCLELKALYKYLKENDKNINYKLIKNIILKYKKSKEILGKNFCAIIIIFKIDEIRNILSECQSFLEIVDALYNALSCGSEENE